MSRNIPSLTRKRRKALLTLKDKRQIKRSKRLRARIGAAVAQQM